MVLVPSQLFNQMIMDSPVAFTPYHRGISSGIEAKWSVSIYFIWSFIHVPVQLCSSLASVLIGNNHTNWYGKLLVNIAGRNTYEIKDHTGFGLGRGEEVMQSKGPSHWLNPHILGTENDSRGIANDVLVHFIHIEDIATKITALLYNEGHSLESNELIGYTF